MTAERSGGTPEPDRTGRPRRRTAIPGSGMPLWLWLTVSCVAGLAVGIVLLHILDAARHLPG